MLRIFNVNNSRLTSINPIESANLFSAIWIDLISPKDDELQLINNSFGQVLVTSQENISENPDISVRYFEDLDGLHIKSLFFYIKKTEKLNEFGNTNVEFTIRDGRLYTLRDRELPVFSLYTMHASNKKMANANPFEILLDLFEIKIEQINSEIENLYLILERVANFIMKSTMSEKNFTWLYSLSEVEQIAGKITSCLMETQRTLNFLIGNQKLQDNELIKAKKFARDVTSLSSHNESVFQKVNFLIQSAMGLINIEQNRIIKIFSVLSVVFLPPTLIASIYGMNFKDIIPEFSWKYGFLAVICAMIVVGFTPYIYFKRRKWL
ncbi:magnesium/cobalt transporter CorA [Candidatus Ishikawella capsulata]|uniref:Magnesium transport protein CorA n=1 Tax=Candidatus Ishikawaella capsulata Mpkobe TaxID=476281 RepID=C5WDQ4_9ENTR|nr:magnesium/cobalt transporter CorA [Candidatus Ishikawaella capsulata]BAH83460.1 magnesium/nickel/cobalt transporter [Candidatus Ishikawaella capsulata Mpkobe]